MLTNPKFFTSKALLTAIKPRFFGSAPQRLGPEYDKREFDAFKYEYEKRRNHLGYTSEELFGKRYGLKHSLLIINEMKKDNYMFYLALFLSGVFVYVSRRNRYEENVDWDVFVHRDMHTVRPIPSHALMKSPYHS